MPSITWTPTAVASEITVEDLEVWRAVEAQHIHSTRSLVDSVREHDILEAIIESVKPPVPATLQGLHFLLSTPFRYPPSPHGSRFRSPADPGVFYAAESISTACAELGYWRWRFLLDSPNLIFIDWKPQTIFPAQIYAHLIDLRRAPFLADRVVWTSQSHAGTQDFARICRSADVGTIRYESVRDPNRGACLAVLSHSEFRGPPMETMAQNWSLYVSRDTVIWRRDSQFLPEEFQFPASEIWPDPFV